MLKFMLQAWSLLKMLLGGGNGRGRAWLEEAAHQE